MNILRVRISSITRERIQKSQYTMGEIISTAMSKYLSGERTFRGTPISRMVSTSVNINPEIEEKFKELVRINGLSFDAALRKVLNEEMEERGI